MTQEKFLSKVSIWLRDKDPVPNAKWEISDCSGNIPNTVEIKVSLTKKIDNFSVIYRGSATTSQSEDSIKSSVDALNDKLLKLLQEDNL